VNAAENRFGNGREQNALFSCNLCNRLTNRRQELAVKCESVFAFGGLFMSPYMAFLPEARAFSLMG